MIPVVGGIFSKLFKIVKGSPLDKNKEDFLIR